MKYVIAIAIALLPFSAWGNAQVLVPPDAYEGYQRFLGDRDPLTITEFSGPGSSRQVVEMILMHQAMAAAEVSIPFEFVPEPDADAIMQALVDGTAVASGTSYWLAELTPKYQSLQISTALLGRGEFDVGLYVHPDAVAGIGSSATLRQISTREWQADWARLEKTGFEALVHWNSWANQVAAVRSGEVSFLIAPFQSGDDMMLELDGKMLAPVPGIKLGLAGSRHMAVSRQHAEGAFFNSALQLGLLRLKERGVVNQAYIEVGFLQPQVADWYRIPVAEKFPDWEI